MPLAGQNVVIKRTWELIENEEQGSDVLKNEPEKILKIGHLIIKRRPGED